MTIRLFPRYRFLRHFTHHSHLRKSSTLVGKSGRVYAQGEILQKPRGDGKLGVFKAESGNESSTLKRVDKWFYNQSLRVAADFPNPSRLRTYVDCNEEEGVLIYPYFKNTLLGLVQDDEILSPLERRKVLRCVGEAIRELHSKGWIHIDIKPDNILVNWICNEAGNKTIIDAALGDFDLAFKPKNGEPRDTPHAIGNVMWRSPEGQTGRGVTKASDIFSFGLVSIFAFGGKAYLFLEDTQELARHGIIPEQDILGKHFCYFGPPTEKLLELGGTQAWHEALKIASDMAEQALKEAPHLSFKQWGEVLGPGAMDLFSRMTQLDPTARPTIDQVLAHEWWQENFDEQLTGGK